MGLVPRFVNPHRPFARAASVALLLAAVGAGDFVLPPLVPGVLLYLLPIALATWIYGSRGGIAVLLLALGVWYVLEGISTAAGVFPTDFWHGLSHFLLYVMIVVLVGGFRSSYREEWRRSRTDPLTGLLNRSAFEEASNAEFARSHRYGHAVSVVFLDLDNFKQVNDRWGHTTGDILLRDVGETLHRCLRSSDLAARLGGDEFALVLTETDANGASRAVEELRRHLAAATTRLPVSFSIGVASYPRAPELPAEAVRLADQLMYEAKRRGKNTVVQNEYVLPA